jgi:hypothetical protein
VVVAAACAMEISASQTYKIFDFHMQTIFWHATSCRKFRYARNYFLKINLVVATVKIW